MNFHEYQSKQLLAEYGIPVPAGKVAATPDEAVAAANSLGQGPWMVKAQIHAGGRGKAGGVKFCKTTDDVKAAAAKMLGTKMATYQTAGVELPVNLVLVTTAGEIVITARSYRTQEANRQDARERLAELLAKAHLRPIKRVKTKASRAAKARRVDSKTRRGAIKAARGRPQTD